MAEEREFGWDDEIETTMSFKYCPTVIIILR